MIGSYWSWPGVDLVPLAVIVGIGLLVALAPILIKFKRANWKLWWALGTSSVLLAGTKALDLLRWELPSLWRQATFVVAVMIIAAVGIGARGIRSSYLPLAGLWPTGARSPGVLAQWRWVRLALGALAIIGPAAALVASKGTRCPSISGCTCWPSIALAGVGVAAWLALAIVEAVRSNQHKEDVTRKPAPDRDILWSVTLAWALLTAGAITSIVTRHPLDSSHLPSADLSELLFVTVIGEELIFRGFLLALALLATSPGRTSGSRDSTLLGYWVVSLGFGLWHVGDAIVRGQQEGWRGAAIVAWVIGNILITTLASRFVLIPLRMRTGTVVAPMLAHLGANAPGIVLDA